MKSRFFCLSLFSLMLLLSGCAHVISKDLREKTNPSITFRQVYQNPNAYKNQSVLWGGEIIETINQKDETTLIEVLQRPLGWRGEPKETDASEGRFLILVEKYLDPYVFQKGRKITVAGEILGEEIKPLGEMDYRYPFLLSDQTYLWQRYPYYPVLPHYYYYDPWWVYPYGWGFGFGIYYPHHRHHRHR